MRRFLILLMLAAIALVAIALATTLPPSHSRPYRSEAACSWVMDCHCQGCQPLSLAALTCQQLQPWNRLLNQRRLATATALGRSIALPARPRLPWLEPALPADSGGVNDRHSRLPASRAAGGHSRSRSVTGPRQHVAGSWTAARSRPCTHRSTAAPQLASYIGFVQKTALDA
jgi:hypothetical protein